MVHCWIFGLKWKSKSKFHGNNIVASFQKKKKALHHGHKASYLFYFVFLATCEALGFQRVDYENICSKAEICRASSWRARKTVEAFQA